MKESVSFQFTQRVRRAVIAIIASGIAAAPAAHANPYGNVVLVPPADLPESARQTGEAMLLHETIDGRALLYIEQKQGARLAILDVTDPGHIKGEGSVQIDASGPFDFVSPLGDRAELIKFRQGRDEAVLNLRKADIPTLETVQGQRSQGPITRLADDGPPPARDYQVIGTMNSRERSGVLNVNLVREEITNTDTGTTFLLAETGLYVVRHPIEEMNKKLRDLNYVN